MVVGFGPRSSGDNYSHALITIYISRLGKRREPSVEGKFERVLSTREWRQEQLMTLRSPAVAHNVAFVLQLERCQR